MTCPEIFEWNDIKWAITTMSVMNMLKADPPQNISGGKTSFTYSYN